MVAVRSEEPVCPDFGAVVAALEQYTRRTGRAAARLSGWEVADEALAPPASLAERLTSWSGDLRTYTYAGDLARAKERAAGVLGATIARGGARLTAREVAVLQNSSQGLLLTLAALKEQGARRLVVAAPCYYAAVRSAQALGFAVEIVPAAEYLTGALDVEALRDAVGRRGGSVLLVTNPAYSVGVEYPATDLAHLVAALRPDLPILLDETRLGLSWRSSAPWYPADYPDNVVALRSPSKVFFVNGAKCALLLAAPTLVRAVERLSEALVGSAPANSEPAALAYLDAWAAWQREHSSGIAGEMLRWREAVVARLRASLAATGPLAARGFVLAPADSGPYALAAVPRSTCRPINSLHLARAAGVLVMDAAYFFHASDGWTGLRLNLCASPGRISTALDQLLPHLPAAGA